MKGTLYFSYLFSVILLFSGCNKRVNNPTEEKLPDSLRIDIPAFGSEGTLEIVTWNIENFPKLKEQTVTDVVEIIRDLDADLYGMQEIEDTVSFRAVLDRLPGYGGLYSSDEYSFGNYQKTAFIYKKGLVEVSNRTMLFPNDYDFPRPPMQVFVVARKNSSTFDFILIVLHLKATTSDNPEQDEQRRRMACRKLKTYLDDKITNSPEKDYIVIGDWNDELNDSPQNNVFQVFFNDSLHRYRFLTSTLNASTYIGFSSGSKIDHILITADTEEEYNSGTTQVLKLDTYFNGYVREVSDHRPVGARFPVF